MADRVDYGDRVEGASFRLGQMSSAEFAAAMVLSYALAVALIVWVVRSVGHWEILAGTRFLDVLISMGVVQFHDLVIPAPFQIPDVGHYFDSQLPIDWRVAAVAAFVFIVFSLLKAYKFSEIARLHGVPGTTGQRMRAYLYGDGIDRFLPFYIGSVGTAAALANQGARFDRALTATAVSHTFMLFEAAVFAIFTLYYLGWSEWVSHLVWPILILVLAYYVVRRDVDVGKSAAETEEGATLARFSMLAGIRMFGALTRVEPGMLIKLCLISILAFLMLDAAIYLITQAWNDQEGSYSVVFPVLIISIVGGYLARMIPITPGGIGQWEFGFAASFAFYNADFFGIDFSFNLAFAAILATVLRSFTGFLLLAFVLIFWGVPTNLRSVIRIFRGVEAPPDTAVQT